MKSITVHGIDQHLAKLLKKEAEATGCSMNRTVKRLLEEAMGVKPRPPGRHREHFEAFCGSWTQEEKAEFEASNPELETVDEQDWQ